MSDDEAYRPRLTALELAHEKLERQLEAQSDQSKHLDRKAARTLQASLAFSGVASAVAYYLTRQAQPSSFGTLDTPLTYAALSFGTLSVLLSVAASHRTDVETDLAPSNVTEGTRYGRKELLLTLVETYPEYVRRNDRRLEFDGTLLSGAQSSLVLAVVCTTGAVGLYVTGTTGDIGASAGAYVSGAIVGGVTTAVLLGLYAENR